GTAKAAAGLEAVIELQVEYGLSLAHTGQRQAHAPRPVIGMKGHAAIALEGTPGGRGVDAAARKVDVAPSGRWLVLDRGEQLPYQRRRAARPIEREAAAARAV